MALRAVSLLALALLASCAVSPIEDTYYVGPGGDPVTRVPSLPRSLDQEVKLTASFKQDGDYIAEEVAQLFCTLAKTNAAEPVDAAHIANLQTDLARDVNERSATILTANLAKVRKLIVVSEESRAAYRIEAIVTVPGANMIDSQGVLNLDWLRSGGDQSKSISAMEIEANVVLNCTDAKTGDTITSGQCRVDRRVNLTADQIQKIQIQQREGQGGQDNSFTQDISRRHILGAVEQATHGAICDLVRYWVADSDS